MEYLMSVEIALEASELYSYIVNKYSETTENNIHQIYW